MEGDRKEEFNEIIRGTLSSPKYLALHLKASLKATASQLVKFKIGDGNGIFLKSWQAYPDKQFLSIVILILLGVIIHAWICGTFANAIDRLGTKMIWLLALAPLLWTMKMKKLY